MERVQPTTYPSPTNILSYEPRQSAILHY